LKMFFPSNHFLIQALKDARCARTSLGEPVDIGDKENATAAAPVLQTWAPVMDNESEKLSLVGRRQKPPSKKFNPIGGSERGEEQLPHWYQPSWPDWRRRLYWYFFRKPLQNVGTYVIGVNDRNYEVIGRAPVMTVQRNDLRPEETGWQWSVTKLAVLRLPFVSCSELR
jgi:hypothetical protein